MIIDRKNPHLGGNIIDINGDSRTYFPVLWKWLIETYHTQSVLDIGCGGGYSACYFSGLSQQVTAIDGLELNIQNIKDKNVLGVVNDYTVKSANISADFDLCWMCEFVEHVNKMNIRNFMLNVQQARVVAMTHALPKQRGYHHVNLQPPIYWEAVFNAYGYILDVDHTNQSKTLADGYWKRSGMIFIKA